MCQVLLQVQIHISFELFKLHHVAIEKDLSTLSVLFTWVEWVDKSCLGV